MSHIARVGVHQFLHRPFFCPREIYSPGVVCGAALLLGLFALGQPGRLYAQAPDSLKQTAQEQLYRVETTEGKVVIGTLVSETKTEVTLKTRQLGEVTLKWSDVESMDNIDPNRLRNGQYWFRNPQSTRYFFAPNALSIPKGSGYYRNTWILFNNVTYGVSDNFSVGAGTIPIFLFGANVVPFWFLPKVSVSIPQTHLHLAGGAMIGGILGTGGSAGAGLLYSSATVGSRNHNATLGLGYGYAGGAFSDTPVINVSGMTRLSRTTYLISENYFFSGAGGGGVLSVGVRWAPENFAFDVGLFRPLSTAGDFLAAPWLGVTIPFGAD